MYTQQKLGYLEFQEVFYDNLSTLVTNSSHIENNYAFYEQVVWKCFEKYNNSKTEHYSINQLIVIFEIVLDAMFKFEPSTTLPEDLINII